jgi:hypothetical protein
MSRKTVVIHLPLFCLVRLFGKSLLEANRKPALKELIFYSPRARSATVSVIAYSALASQANNDQVIRALHVAPLSLHTTIMHSFN